MSGAEKRKLQRQVLAKKRLYLSEIKNLQHEEAPCTNLVFEAPNIIEIDEESEDPQATEQIPLKQKLRQLFIKHNVSRDFGDDLLEILHSEGLDVPLSTKSLLQIPRSKAVIRTVACGEYIHLGLANQLYKLKDQLNDVDCIEIDIGIDGVPLFKSSSKSLWPILGRTVGFKNKYTFVIGAYYGVGKPKCINSYLHDFTSEIKSLFEVGLQWGHKVIKKRFYQ